VSIVTKTGDKGETSLMYGRRLSKADPRVDAYGCVDELTPRLVWLGPLRPTNSFPIKSSPHKKI
jgi:cob(I)alamin adenosyltransferase